MWILGWILRGVGRGETWILGAQVRLWNIPEQNGRVVDYADVHEMVTAATFSADGRRTVVGTMKGKCRFYQCSPAFKLEYEAQIGVAQPHHQPHHTVAKIHSGFESSKPNHYDVLNFICTCKSL